MVVIKVLAIIGVIVGIYFFIEEQLDINLNTAKMDEKEDGNTSRYLESVTGASLDEQLIEVLLMISSCLKAGRNLDQAFELVAVSTPPPICNEFRTLVQERRLGVPMVEALTNLGNRVPSQDLRLAVNATIFQQETGGNLEDLYQQILLTISERKKIMGKIVAGTAHARLSGNLVATIPVILAIILLYMQPDYLKPMLTNSYGQIALLIAVTATIIGVVFINRITTSILPDADEAMISKNESSIRTNRILKVFRLIIKPFALLMNFLPQKSTNRLRNETRFLLNASGKAGVFEIDEFMGLMLLSMIVFAFIMMIFVNPVAMGAWAWLVLLLLLPIGFRLPRIYLAHLIKKRQKNIEFELPYVIDLLSLAIESGLDLIGGISKVVEKSKNTDIIVEFKMFLADIKVGKSMEEALADMAERVKVLSFFSFVSSLIQAQRLGADIGPTLRAQAEQMRYQRLILAEERVNKLPVKLLIPLVFFVFPSISVLLIGPAMIQIQTKFPKPNKATSQETSKKVDSVKILKKDVTTVNTTTLNKVEHSNQKEQIKNDKKVINKVIQKNHNAVPEIKETKVNKTNGLSDNTTTNNNKSVIVVPNVTPAPIIITEPVETKSEVSNKDNIEQIDVQPSETLPSYINKSDEYISDKTDDGNPSTLMIVPLEEEVADDEKIYQERKNKVFNQTSSEMVPIERYIGE